MEKFLLISAGMGLGAGVILGAGARAWDGTTSRLVDRIHAAGTPTASRVSFAELDSLPAPVARYFRHVLRDGQPRIRQARIKQRGEFWLNGTWIPFTAEQHFSASTPGMVWDATMRMNPLLSIRVRDAYAAGRGSMQARVLSLLPVVDQQNKPELNAGALQRYLAEAVWFPTALLPSERLVWSPIDDSRARATLTDSGTTVSTEFTFNQSGEITRVFTPGRYREINGRYELTPWGGVHLQYGEFTGMRIPTSAEVAWQLPEGPLPYCRLRILDIAYQLDE